MGCWNGTDFITQLPIMAGEHIKLFILKDAGELYRKYSKHGTVLSGGGYCYTDGLMIPICLPISGKYNDYGGIESVEEDFNTDMILKRFYDTGEFGEDEIINSNHRYSQKKYGIQTLCNGIERGHGKLDGVHCGTVMILDSVYNGIIKFMDTSKDWEGKLYKTIIENSINVYLDAYQNKQKNDYEILRRNPLFDLNQDFESYVKLLPLPEKDFTYMKKLYFNMKKLIWFMGSTRKSWMIQSGAGSQSDNYDNFIALADITKKHAKEAIKRWDE